MSASDNSVAKSIPRGERARIEALIAREEARLRRAFRVFLDTVRSEAVRRQLRLALESGGVEMALRLIDAHIVTMSAALTTVFQGAATSEMASIARRMGTARAAVAITFDPGSPRAAAAMRRNRLEFVREFTRSQREATRAALVEAVNSGAGAAKMGRALRDSIGLTETQRRSVANYRRLLEAGDAAALTRDLRDRRFDRSVRRAVDAGEPLGAKRIDKMVAQYRASYLRYRAEAVARTEVKRATGAARREAVEQVFEQVDMPRAFVRRVWGTTRDGRERDTHGAMNGQRVAVDEPFVSPSGARLMFPGDTSLGAPASEIVHCRCIDMYDLG